MMPKLKVSHFVFCIDLTHLDICINVFKHACDITQRVSVQGVRLLGQMFCYSNDCFSWAVFLNTSFSTWYTCYLSTSIL